MPCRARMEEETRLICAFQAFGVVAVAEDHVSLSAYIHTVLARDDGRDGTGRVFYPWHDLYEYLGTCAFPWLEG